MPSALPRLTRRALPLLALALLAAGCPRPDASDPASDPAAGTTPRRAFPAPADNTLVFARGGDSVGLDPAHEDDGESIKVIESLYDGLVQFKAGTTEVEPALATSWEIADDGLTYTFHLRQGVTFHDGTPFDADAVLFSLMRQMDPAHPFHSVAGSHNKYWDSMGMNEIVSSITKTDGQTIVIKLKHPEAPFLSNLAMHFACIVSPAAVARLGDQFPRQPVGTGAFKFVVWNQEQNIVLEAFDAHWAGRPKLDRVIYEVIKDRNIRALKFESGEIHGLDDPSPSEFESLQSMKHAKVLQQPGMNVGYLAMNLESKPFDDVRVRRAVNHAINKKRIIDDIYKGLGMPAKNPLPASMWGHDDSIEDFAYDPAVARGLLNEAGHPQGFTTTLYFMPVSRPYMPDGKRVAEAIQLDLREIGIFAELRTFDWATYLDKVNNGEHDMALLGWSGDNGDPDNFLYNLLSAQAASNKPTQNIAFYRNAEFSDLITQAKRVSDQAARTALYRQAQHVFHADPPWVCLAHNVQTVVVREDVEGLVLTPSARKDFRPVYFRQ